MSHLAQTPEALLLRSDSKNPSTTCRGITVSGRPCRRDLAQACNNVIRPEGGLLTPESEAHIAAWYCYQHKRQAGVLPLSSSTQPVRRQASLDTLVQQLGLLDVGDPRGHDRRTLIEQQSRQLQIPAAKKAQQLGVHQKVHSSGDLGYAGRERASPRPKPRVVVQNRKPHPPGFLQSFFCLGPSHDHDYTEVVRHRKRVQGIYSPTTPLPNDRQRPRAHHASLSHQAPPLAAENPNSRSPLNKALDFIPVNLSSKISGDLLQELLKPVSLADKQGYIYIYWLTDEETAVPPSSLTSNLLTAESPGRPQNNRRTSDAIRDYASGSNGKTKTILLKIGRSNNVHRRMSEWSKQCRYNLSLVRFYPHQSSSEKSSGSGLPHMPGKEITMVPYVHKVERLIHLELAEKRVKQAMCVTCEQVHREWFEVEASRQGLGAVDAAIKRWIRWAEQNEQPP